MKLKKKKEVGKISNGIFEKINLNKNGSGFVDPDPQHWLKAKW